MIAVDTNLVAYLLIPGAHTASAESVRAKDADWHGPSLLLHEWLNVITMYVQHGNLDRDEAARIYRRRLAVVKIDHAPPDPIRIINLHLSSGCSSYDCPFVATAQGLNAKLVTADAEVLRSFPDVAESLDQYIGTQ